MAAESGGSTADVVRRLERSPTRFDAFQAVRVLLRAAAEERRDTRQGAEFDIGRTSPPDAECIRFRAAMQLAFPGSTVASVERKEHEGRPATHEVVVTFLGMAGPAGVLPNHYTRLVLERMRAGDRALRDFLDLFNHRAISFFYRAWERHRLPVGYERSATRAASREDVLTQCLYALVGFGTSALHPVEQRSSVLRGRLGVSDETLLYYAGVFVHRPRSLLGVRRLLSDFLGAAVNVEQFRGQWLHLGADDQSQLPSGLRLEGVNCALGTTAMLGARVWVGESRFRLRLGPLSWRQFCEFAPGSLRLRQLSELTGLLAGPEYDFDVQPVLRASELPCAQLGAASRLGWDSWILSRPRTRDGDEAVFAPEGALAPISGA